MACHPSLHNRKKTNETTVPDQLDFEGRSLPKGISTGRTCCRRCRHVRVRRVVLLERSGAFRLPALSRVR